MTAQPSHPRSFDKTHPLYVARQWNTCASMARQLLETARENRDAVAAIFARGIAADPGREHELQVTLWQLDEDLAAPLSKISAAAEELDRLGEHQIAKLT